MNTMSATESLYFLLFFGVGFLLCASLLVVLLFDMRKAKNVDDAIINPVFLVPLAGFCIFPFINIVVGATLWTFYIISFNKNKKYLAENNNPDSQWI